MTTKWDFTSILKLRFSVFSVRSYARESGRTDDTESDKRALFKDISIKKGSLYAGQTQNSTSVNATLPADPNITIQQLVDFVKSDFSDSPAFLEAFTVIEKHRAK